MGQAVTDLPKFCDTGFSATRGYLDFMSQRTRAGLELAAALPRCRTPVEFWQTLSDGKYSNAGLQLELFRLVTIRASGRCQFRAEPGYRRRCSAGLKYRPEIAHLHARRD